MAASVTSGFSAYSGNNRLREIMMISIFFGIGKVSFRVQRYSFPTNETCLIYW